MSMRKRRESRQEEMFVQTSALPDSPGHPFYTQLRDVKYFSRRRLSFFPVLV